MQFKIRDSQFSYQRDRGIIGRSNTNLPIIPFSMFQLSNDLTGKCLMMPLVPPLSIDQAPLSLAQDRYA